MDDLLGKHPDIPGSISTNISDAACSWLRENEETWTAWVAAARAAADEECSNNLHVAWIILIILGVVAVAAVVGYFIHEQQKSKVEVSQEEKGAAARAARLKLDQNTKSHESVVNTTFLSHHKATEGGVGTIAGQFRDKLKHEFPERRLEGTTSRNFFDGKCSSFLFAFFRGHKEASLQWST